MKLIILALVLVAGIAKADIEMMDVNGVMRPAYVEGEVIVKYKTNAVRTMAATAALYQRLSVVDVKRFSGRLKNFEHLLFNTEALTVERAVAELNQNPNVEYAQPNYLIYALKHEKTKTAGTACISSLVPFPIGCEVKTTALPGERPAIPPPAEDAAEQRDPDLAQAWGISKVGADRAWDTQRGSRNIIVAVIDTGIDYTHPDLAANIWRNPNGMNTNQTGVDAMGEQISGDVVGWDFVHNDNLPFDDNMHGTHCAGVIGAVGENGIGISGINQRVSLLAAKFISAEGSGTTAAAIRAIDYAVSRGAKVLSNSWGGKSRGDNRALEESVRNTGTMGALFVAAAGNSSTDNDFDPTMPASLNFDNMINVAATDTRDQLASFSNRGIRTVHLGAPGVNIYSTVPGGYNRLSGTSMACPHVAGAAALLWAQDPSADYREIKRRLLASGDSVPSLANTTSTGKRLNVLKALSQR